MGFKRARIRAAGTGTGNAGNVRADVLCKSRFEVLLGVKEHEIHHRAQVMLMQRMLGIVPHGTRAFAERLAQAQKPAVAG